MLSGVKYKILSHRTPKDLEDMVNWYIDEHGFYPIGGVSVETTTDPRDKPEYYQAMARKS